MFKENKSSKLVIQSYLNGKLSNKILMTDLNSKVERYRKEKFVEKIQKRDKHELRRQYCFTSRQAVITRQGKLSIYALYDEIILSFI